MERHGLEGLFEGNLLKVKVIPNSSNNEIVGYDNEKKELKIKLKAQPEKGKANHELILFFKKNLGLNIEIVKGRTTRKKIVRMKKN
ncbi:MAG: YggU family protein [Nanoarchaeota archaeon]|nr:YggU family protein [Nanoarchaeota archaeon]